MRRGSAPRAHAAARGYSLVALLALMAVLSIGLAVAGPTWADRKRRERERELLHIGALYAQALAEYRDSAPGSLKSYPNSLDELLLDRRFVGVRRHLRQLYPDPLGPATPWGLMYNRDGGIIGVYSQSQDAPLASVPIPLGTLTLPPARRYSDWKFTPVQPS